MDARGVGANLISLGSVDFGIIIDSAVVLVEALMVKLAVGAAEHDPLHSGYGWRVHTLKNTAVELGRPIMFSKAIIILAFMPIFTFQRVEGKIFAPMAYTLSFALLGAILLTLTLVPALLSYALRRHDLAERHSAWMERLQRRYRTLLNWAALRRKPIVAARSPCSRWRWSWRPGSGASFFPSSTKATSGSLSRCRRRLRWSAPRTSSARCAACSGATRK